MNPGTKSDSEFATARSFADVPGQEARVDAAAHLKWLLAQSDFLVQLELLRQEGYARKYGGLAYRERPSASSDEQPQDLDRWQERRRKLGSVLPEKLSGLLLLPRVDASLLGSLTLQGLPRWIRSQDKVSRLQDVCLQRLANINGKKGPGLSGADQKFLERTLRALDPEGVDLAGWTLAPGAALARGTVAHAHATAYDARIPIAAASTAGCPPFGCVVASDPLRIRPLTFKEERYTFIP